MLLKNKHRSLPAGGGGVCIWGKDAAGQLGAQATALCGRVGADQQYQHTGVLVQPLPLQAPAGQRCRHGSRRIQGKRWGCFFPRVCQDGFQFQGLPQGGAQGEGGMGRKQAAVSAG